jgi:Tfp pilus assembly protein PilX
MSSKSDQQGFITMIIVIVLILIAVIGFAFMRVSSVKH